MAPRWPVRTAAAKRPVRGQDALLRYHAKMSKSLSFCFLMSFSNLELCQLVLTSLTEENTKTPCWTKVRNGEFSEKRRKKKRIYLWISSIAHGAKHGVVRQLLESKWMGMSPKPKRKPLNCPCSSIFDTLFQKENCSMSWGSPNCHKTHAAKMGIPWGDFLRNHGGNPGHPKLLPPERSWKIIDWWSPPSSSTTRWLTALYEYLIFW